MISLPTALPLYLESPVLLYLESSHAFPTFIHCWNCMWILISSAHPHLWCSSRFCSRFSAIHSLHLPTQHSFSHLLLIITFMLTIHNSSLLSPLNPFHMH